MTATVKFSLPPEQHATRERCVFVRKIYWSDVLGINQVGVNDNFFDLGGHSLACHTSDRTGDPNVSVRPALKALFDSPTIADMAVVITQNQATRAGDGGLLCMLSEVEAMSDEEAKRRLSAAGTRNNRADGHE
jgi:hypothetical protein